MKCPKCQFENREGAKFCLECGEKLELQCPQCGKALPIEAKFCDGCGHDLREPKEAPPIDYSKPQSYTPKFLADKILTNRSSIEGERKLVTVLFADVANYTSIAEKLDPEEVHQIMDGFFKILMDEIHRYEGTINQFTGDGVMALFGAPVAHEDHAQRACYAALSAQRAVQAFSMKIKDNYGVDFMMRMGLNSGPVVVGSIGDNLRMDYTAIGDTTNLAARMESIARPGTILVSRDTFRLVREFFEFESLGKAVVKGKEEEQETYELIRATEIETRIGASVVKGLTRFVGRKNSMAALMEAYDKAQAGSGQVVGMVGEAGVGKSRLLLELRNQLPQGKFTYLEGRCLHYGGSMAYLPILDILRAYFNIKEGDHEFDISKKIEDKILQLDENLRSLLPSFQDLLSLKVEDEAYLKLEPKQKREKVFEAIRDLLIRESQNRLLVLAVEDLHWIDKTSEGFFDYLIDWLASTHILFILLYRPEYNHQWGSKSYYRKIGLNQLTDQSSAELVQAILEEGEVGPEIRELILNRTSGNPLYMEELTHTLLENGSIQKKDHRFFLSGKASEIEIPDTIQGIIAARMDRLEDNLKRTMQVASVIGRDFAFRILHTISGMKEELKSYLLNLQGLEFIYEKSLFPELEYIFKHALTQEVAYNSLLLKRRKEIHEQIGKAIEELYPERLEELYKLLAYHYARSESKEKAIEYALLAGDRAARFYANVEAKSYYDQALTIVQTLPTSPSTQRWRIDATLKLAEIAMNREDLEWSQENLERVRALAEDLHDKPRLARSLYWLGRIQYTLGNCRGAIDFASQSLEIADRLGDETLEAPPVNLMGRAYWMTSDYAKASQMMERSVEQMCRLGNKNEEGTAAGFAGWAFGMLGEFDRALSYADRGIQIAQEIQNPFAEAAALMYRAVVLTYRGEWMLAIEDYQRGIHVAEGVKDLFRISMLKGGEGWAHTKVGNPTHGRVLIEESFAVAEQIGMRFGLFFNKFWEADCLLALGEFNAVPPLCQEAIRLAEEGNDKLVKSLAHRTLSEALLCLEPVDLEKAESAILEAIRIQKEIGARPELARSYVSHAKLLKAKGECERAKEYLAKAIDMFQQMGMTWDLAQAEQALQEF
jgi:class 3 adenylate cyclase/tetratricopeptide (TPR) repeat protein